MTPHTPQVIESDNGTSKLEAPLAALVELIHREYRSLSEEDMKRICRQVVKESVPAALEEIFDDKPRKVEVVIQKDHEIPVDGRQHYLFPLIIKLMTIPGINLALTGPAGSGKTQAVINAAKTLGLNLTLITCNPKMSPAAIFGHVLDKYYTTPFRKSFEEGNSIILFDEFDSLDPALGVSVNAAFSNRVITFPDGKFVKAGDNWFPIVAMNTVGLGATEQYCGRNRLDAATLDRFIQLFVPYDEGLESSFIGVEQNSPECNYGKRLIRDAESILQFVRDARAFSAEQGWKNIVSPRATIFAHKLAQHGIGKEFIFDLVLGRGLNDAQRVLLKKHLAI